MSGCLADVAAALVDGELDHAARERALRHLLRCPACRAEVDLQRRLKARLRDVGPPSPSDALTSRLLGLPATTPLGPPEARTADPVDRPLGPPPTPGPVPRRPAARTHAPIGPPGRLPAARRRAGRRTAAGSAFAVLGLAAGLALTAPAQRPASTPVDPTSDAFVAEFARTASGGAGAPVTSVPATRTGVRATFVPLTRGTLLSSGGDRGPR